MQIYMHAVILSIARPPCLTQSLNNCSCTGIMPIMTYGGFKRMTGFCKTKIPAEVSEALEAIKDNDEAVKVGFGPPCCAPCCLVIDCVYILIAGLQCLCRHVSARLLLAGENDVCIPRRRTAFSMRQTCASGFWRRAFLACTYTRSIWSAAQLRYWRTLRLFHA